VSVTEAPGAAPTATPTATPTRTAAPTAPTIGPVDEAAVGVATQAPPVEAPLALSIADVAERTGVTAHTLRYYERIGLLSVPRDEAGRRVYTDAELARVVFITRLRMTAMPIRKIQAYFRLVAEGPGTEPERLALLQRQRDEVRARMDDLQTALEAIEYKIAVYGGSCTP
jgi:DNA-binding transcriptional MerR regulator